METKGYGEVRASGPPSSLQVGRCDPGRLPSALPIAGVGKWLWLRSRGLSRCWKGAQANLLLPALWSLFGKGQCQNFGWRKYSLFWVLTNPNISPLPEACFLYITQQVSPLPDYSFKGHLKPLFFIHYLNVFSSQQPLSPAPRLPQQSILPRACGGWHHFLKCRLEALNLAQAELIALIGLSCGTTRTWGWEPLGFRGPGQREEAARALPGGMSSVTQ